MITGMLNLAGDNREIGRQLGQYWASRIARYRNSKSWKCLMRKGRAPYLAWINNGAWDRYYEPLLRNLEKAFPELIDELVGMAAGIRESDLPEGKNVSVLDVFSLWLGETERPGQCSSMVIKKSHGYILAHNEEESFLYPVVPCRVALNTTSGLREFISVSYPFQLLGCAVGLNRNLAFQGNSIFCSRATEDRLIRSWERRIPKSVFTRKALECNSVDEIVGLYEEHHTTLPNHQYVVTQDRAWSLEIRPKLGRGHAIKQVKKRELDSPFNCHTNHFEDNGIEDLFWKIGNLRDSRARRKFLSLYAMQQGDAFDFLKKMAVRSAKARKTTLATVVVDITSKRPKFKCLCYFADTSNKPTAIEDAF